MQFATGGNKTKVNHVHPFCPWSVVPTSGLAGNPRPGPRKTKALATDLAMSSPEPRLESGGKRTQRKPLPLHGSPGSGLDRREWFEVFQLQRETAPGGGENK